VLGCLITRFTSVKLSKFLFEGTIFESNLPDIVFDFTDGEEVVEDALRVALSVKTSGADVEGDACDDHGETKDPYELGVNQLSAVERLAELDLRRQE
jgi:hypothetical protein